MKNKLVLLLIIFMCFGFFSNGQNEMIVLADNTNSIENYNTIPNYRTFHVYAPPMYWGDWQTIASHFTGDVSYEIKAWAIGDTQLKCQVRYFKGEGAGEQVIEDFYDGDYHKITVCDNCAANVEVRFKGVPLGTAVKGMINP